MTWWAMSGIMVGSASATTVSARSGAEMPVGAVTGFDRHGKIGAVAAPFNNAISGSSKASTRSLFSVRQISPRPCMAIKLMASGVAIWAGITKSPHFHDLRRQQNHLAIARIA